MFYFQYLIKYGINVSVSDSVKTSEDKSCSDRDF